MDNPYISDAAVFLINTVFNLYIFAVLLRFLMQWVRADFYNPVSQFVVKITNPPLRPLRRVIPGLGGIDLASVILLIALEMINLALLNLAVGRVSSALGLVVTAIAELLSTTITLFFITILIEVILSWIAAGAYNPVVYLVHQLNSPLLAPARRLIPSIGGIDLSPLVVVIVLQLLRYLVVAPLMDLGHGMG
jgi:YggT family protein